MGELLSNRLIYLNFYCYFDKETEKKNVKVTVRSSESEAPGDPPKQKTLLPGCWSWEFANHTSQAPLPSGVLLDSARRRCWLAMTRQGRDAGGLCLWGCGSCWVSLVVDVRGLQAPVAQAEVEPFLVAPALAQVTPLGGFGVSCESVSQSSEARGDLQTPAPGRSCILILSDILSLGSPTPFNFSSVLPALIIPPLYEILSIWNT